MAEKLKKYIFYAAIVAVASPLVSSQNPIFGLLIRQETLFQVAVEVLAVLYVALMFLDPSYRPKLSPIGVGVLALLATWGLATLFSENSYRSFFSSRERVFGYFLLLHLGAFFFIVASVFRNAIERRSLLQVSVITSVLVSLYGISQQLGLILLPGRVDGLRVFSTLGNPSFLAGYLLFNLAFGGYLFHTDKRQTWRNVWLGSIILNTLVLFLTGTRGAFLGFYAGLLVFLVMAVFALKGRDRVLARWALLGLLIAPLALILISRSGIVPERGNEGVFYFSRLTRLPELWRGGLRNRVLAWQIAWDASLDRPLFGWGPEQFGAAFDRYFNPEMISAAGSPESHFDRSHNIFVDALAMQGVVGLAAMLFFLGALFWAAKPFWRREKIVGAMLVAALVAYVVQGMFIFDTFGVYLALFLTAFVLAPPAVGEAIASRRHFTPRQLAVVPLIAVAALFIISRYNFGPARAQGLAYQAFSVIHKDPALFETTWNRAFSYPHSYEKDAWLELTDYLFGEVAGTKPRFSGPVLKGYVSFAKDEFLTFRLPLDARLYYQAGKLGNFLSVLGDPNYEFSQENLSHALELAPRRLDIYYEFAELERLRGNHEEQFEWIQKAIAIHENVSFSWWNLGIAYADMKDYRRAVQMLEKAIGLGYIRWQNAEQIPYLVAVYDEGGGPISRIVEFWEMAVYLDQTNAQFFASLAASYAAKGDKGRARQAALRAVEIDPAFKLEAERFLQNLGD